jgi:hypothetical protein
VVNNLKGKYSSGFDDVMDSIVRNCGQIIRKPLADISNASFASRVLPEKLKITIIKPLH